MSYFPLEAIKGQLSSCPLSSAGNITASEQSASNSGSPRQHATFQSNKQPGEITQMNRVSLFQEQGNVWGIVWIYLNDNCEFQFIPSVQI